MVDNGILSLTMQDINWYYVGMEKFIHDDN